MKLKMLKLLLLFLATGLFVSSKETAGNNKTNCNLQYLKYKNCSTEKTINKQKETAGNPFALAPGSYIFYY